MVHFPLAKKRFGQNFLCDDMIIDKIVALIHPVATDHLVEIGPGLGAITLPLLPQVNKIDAIELDRDIIPLLLAKAQDQGQLTVYQQDVLSFDFSRLSQQPQSLRIIGNLPYNISTALLFHLFKQKYLFIDMHFMLQKEVAQRLVAKPNCKQYGRLSIMAQYQCNIDIELEVPPSAFKPAPQIDSSVVRLVPKTFINLPAVDHTIFEQVVRLAFSMRRKTLYNSIKNLISKTELLSVNIDPNLRPEQLSVDNFVKISNIIAKHE